MRARTVGNGLDGSAKAGSLLRAESLPYVSTEPTSSGLSALPNRAQRTSVTGASSAASGAEADEAGAFPCGCEPAGPREENARAHARTPSARLASGTSPDIVADTGTGSHF